MRIKNITINNYRLLRSVSVDLEDDITLVVGKNNSGKTSFFEVLRMLLSDESKLTFEDFSQTCYVDFKKAHSYFEASLIAANDEDKEEAETQMQETIPKIELYIEIVYDKVQDSLIELSEFITDLDINRNDACILVSYESINSLGLFKAYHSRKDNDLSLMKHLQENVETFYRNKCFAFDITTGKKREIEGSYKNKIRKIVSFEEIKALRILDDKKGDRNNTLALGFAKYYHQRDKTTDDVENLERSLKDIGDTLKGKYKDILKNILEDLKRFGGQTPIIIPDIIIDSVFDSEAVIKNNIRYYYKQDEIDLPESYNGLGYSNLIYMILEFASFIEKYKNAKEEKISEFLVVMIEEPEAHMHPQMQQVFISQIKGLLDKAKLSTIFTQLIITSHSSHIISEAGIDLEKGFNRIRYFTKELNEVIAKDFNHLNIKNEKKTFRFLKQYLNLHKSDLFFADKVIMVEGITERLLMPQMISKVAPSLQSEYITILEVGGAYTHKFKEILDFINIKTLLITDLDSVNAVTSVACAVNILDLTLVTSNETLKQWLPQKTLISELIGCKEEAKIHNELVRVAFQISELKHLYYPRSFEEAFINKNRDFIFSEKSIAEDGKTTVKSIKNEFSLFRGKSLADLKASVSYDLAPDDSKVKTNFAFDIMSFQEDIYGPWEVPFYIKEGLEWLAGICLVHYEVTVKE